ncbi:MAG: threonylcarbamoyl-AMP synthase [Muribaculaceae bacterium]|nr:threonylcarbamoyl-AMP synthase [Muribaculaceae bacterium]
MEDLKRAVDVLRRGGVILYPTDTVWGLGCDARNPSAVARIYTIKQRESSKALITLVNSLSLLERTVEKVPDIAYSLIEYSERPLTVIYDKAINVASNLIAEDGSLAVRLTRNKFAASLCRLLNAPIVSTSANVSGEPTPGRFKDISETILNSVDYVCESYHNVEEVKSPSTIMKLHNNGEFEILRP